MDESTRYVTVDTNLYQDTLLIAIGRGLPYIHLYSTTITESEVGNTVVLGSQLENKMWGTAWDEVIFSPNRSIPKDDNVKLVQDILKVVTGGGVVYPRDNGSPNKGIINNINDAQILAAHCARKHHIFVSNDTKFFGKSPKDNRRVALENLCKTKIMTCNEFKAEFGVRMGGWSDLVKSENS